MDELILSETVLLFTTSKHSFIFWAITCKMIHSIIKICQTNIFHKYDMERFWCLLNWQMCMRIYYSLEFWPINFYLQLKSVSKKLNVITFLYSILSSQSKKKKWLWWESYNDKISFHFGSIGQFIDTNRFWSIKKNVLGDLHFCRHVTELWCPIQQLWQLHSQFRER